MARMNFVLENRHFLSFGSLYAALTTFGSLYFVGLFNPAVQAEFGLSHGELGAIYSLSVVLSFPFLIWLGRLIDEVDLRLYAVGVSAAFVAGCYLMAWAPIVVAFAAAVYLVRLTGDWLMDHTALTSTARVFGANRGKALAVVRSRRRPRTSDPALWRGRAHGVGRLACDLGDHRYGLRRDRNPR